MTFPTGERFQVRPVCVSTFTKTKNTQIKQENKLLFLFQICLKFTKNKIMLLSREEDFSEIFKDI